MYRYWVTNSYWKCKQRMVLRGRTAEQQGANIWKWEKERKREMCLLSTLMLQCPLLRRGRTQGPYHPIYCLCLLASQLISPTKSRIICQLSFIVFLSHPCPSVSLSLSLCPSSSHVSMRSLLLYPHWCLKRVLESLSWADSTYSAHQDIRETSIKKCIK